jgi:hypothetical protein
MSHLHFGFLGLFLLRLVERHQLQPSTLRLPRRRRLLTFVTRLARQQSPPAMQLDDHLRGDLGLPPLDSRGRGRRHR